jgi:hypothetical protein
MRARRAGCYQAARRRHPDVRQEETNAVPDECGEATTTTSPAGKAVYDMFDVVFDGRGPLPGCGEKPDGFGSSLSQGELSVSRGRRK